MEHSDVVAGEGGARDAGPEDRFREAVRALDLDAVEREFHDQGELVFLPRFLPADLVDEMQAEVRRFEPHEIHRAYVPWVRKGGAVAGPAIARKAPLLDAFYRSPSLRDLLSRLARQTLELKSASDPHASALYVYDRRGDHVGFHYDDCGCEGAASYTATLGLINRTASRVHFQLFKKSGAGTPGTPAQRAMKELYLSMEPGSLVFFCGSKAYHRVLPLERGEHRVAYSFAFAKDGAGPTGTRRITEDLKDALLYFGPKAMLRRNAR